MDIGCEVVVCVSASLRVCSFQYVMAGTRRTRQALSCSNVADKSRALCSDDGSRRESRRNQGGQETQERSIIYQGGILTVALCRRVERWNGEICGLAPGPIENSCSSIVTSFKPWCVSYFVSVRGCVSGLLNGGFGVEKKGRKCEFVTSPRLWPLLTNGILITFNWIRSN